MTKPLTPEQEECVARLRAVVAERAEVERLTVDAVRDARAAGWTWGKIAPYLGRSTESARRRYRDLVA